MYPESLENLIECFKYLPGIGEKTAERLAFSVLDMDEERTEYFQESIKNCKKNIIANCYICKDNLLR